MNDLKRKNGYGSVYRLKGRRSRPYIAVITTACDYDTQDKLYHQKRQPLGYYETRDEAIVALFMHNQRLQCKKSEDGSFPDTFRDIYTAWKQIHFQALSDSMIRTWECTYRFFEPIHSKIFTEIRPIDLEACISAPDLHSTTRLRMKGLCNQLYKYAIKAGLTEKNPVPLLDRIKTDPPVYPHKPFTEEELRLLWKNRSLPYVDLILIACYTGLRPTELISLKHGEISFSDAELHCGIKTNAGRNRCIPLHPEILPLFRRYAGTSLNTGTDSLFLNEDQKPMDYPAYRYRFKKIMNRFGMKHRPHDTRHTFITLAKQDGMDEYLLKLIVGHAISDLTEKVYTHRTNEQLHDEIRKLHIRF